jgi:hypothetical protein
MKVKKVEMVDCWDFVMMNVAVWSMVLVGFRAVLYLFLPRPSRTKINSITFPLRPIQTKLRSKKILSSIVFLLGLVVDIWLTI